VGERDLRVDLADDPFTRDFATIIVLQVVRGLAVGSFIPASLGFILRSLTPQWWIWGLGAYAFRFVFSQNIAGRSKPSIRKPAIGSGSSGKTPHTGHDRARLARDAAREGSIAPCCARRTGVGSPSSG